MAGRHESAAIALSARAAEDLRTTDGSAERAEILARYLQQNAGAAERMVAALATLRRIDASPGVDLDEWTEAVRRVATREAAWVRRLAGSSGGHLSPGPSPLRGGEPNYAADEVPARRGMGPVDVDMAIQLCPVELQRAWAALQASYGARLDELGPLLQYWADGQRTVAEIAAEVRLETGQDLPAELAVGYFTLLGQAGFIDVWPARSA